MAENPLLPNRKLQELYTLLQHCAALDKPARRGSSTRSKAGREALLAATAIHLEPGDLLSVPAGDVAAASLAPEPLRAQAGAPGAWPQPPRSPRLYLQAAAAAALKSSGDRVVAALFETSQPEPGWQEALSWSQHELLPLILICADRSGSAAFRRGRGRPAGRNTPGWAAVEALTRRLQLPVVTVDGLDAVALYRVMQESVLRARMGGGPALVWAILPSASERSLPSARPLARLRKYLSVRKIAVPA